tara:strand:+ start:685 stop:1458 length:774 start_codon:yes stop_codon:yes gene_type:complete
MSKTKAKDTNNIQDYWESLGKSACPDDVVRDMSIKAIINNFDDGTDLVLDLGCGNGFCTFKFAEKNVSQITGADYSKKSVEQAKQAKSFYDSSIIEKINFAEEDALNLSFDDHSFDTVITIRCLINVGESENQISAMKEIYRILKPGGKYLMCENFTSGLSNLNKVRQSINLDKIEQRWHNNYIDEKIFFKEAKKFFELENEIDFASSYYLLTRVIKAWTSKENGEEPSYNDDFNVMASKIPSVGCFSPMKLFVLRK